MSNKQQLAVEWYANKIHEIERMLEVGAITLVAYYEFLAKAINQAKEMEKEQSEKYAAFCIKCFSENLPVASFEEWIMLQGGNK